MTAKLFVAYARRKYDAAPTVRGYSRPGTHVRDNRFPALTNSICLRRIYTRDTQAVTPRRGGISALPLTGSRHGRSRKSRVRVTSSGVRDACSGQRVPRACQPTRVETAPDCAASVHALFNRTVCCKCDRQPVEGSSRRPIAVRGALHEFDTEAVIQVSATRTSTGRAIARHRGPVYPNVRGNSIRSCLTPSTRCSPCHGNSPRSRPCRQLDAEEHRPGPWSNPIGRWRGVRADRHGVPQGDGEATTHPRKTDIR